MEPLSALPHKPRWWHSRTTRRRLICGPALAIYLYELWQHYSGSGYPSPAWGLFLVGTLILEWLWFRFLDPNYPDDDIRGERIGGPPSATVPDAAWQGALAAAAILGLIVLGIWLL